MDIMYPNVKWLITEKQTCLVKFQDTRILACMPPLLNSHKCDHMLTLGSPKGPSLSQLHGRNNISCLQADGEHSSLTTYRSNSAESTAAAQHQTAPWGEPRQHRICASLRPVWPALLRPGEPTLSRTPHMTASVSTVSRTDCPVRANQGVWVQFMDHYWQWHSLWFITDVSRIRQRGEKLWNILIIYTQGNNT